MESNEQRLLGLMVVAVLERVMTSEMPVASATRKVSARRIGTVLEIRVSRRPHLDCFVA